jgi:hypothetical protein
MIKVVNIVAILIIPIFFVPKEGKVENNMPVEKAPIVQAYNANSR